MKPPGNDNALYSLETVTCFAFYLVIQFLFGETDMHDILEFLSIKKKIQTPPKRVFSCMTIPLTGASHPQASI